jgi:WD40 repeat protein
MWKLEGGKLTRAGQLETVGETVRAVALSPDGRLAATSAATGARTRFRTQGIDPTTCAPVLEKSAAVFAPPTPLGTMGMKVTSPDGEDTPIMLSFSADGAWLVSGARDGASATLWRVGEDTITEKAFLEGHTSSVFAAAFSPSGRYLLTAGQDATTILWRFEPASGRAEKIEYLAPGGDAPSGFPTTIAWSADGTHACLGGGHARGGRMWCYTVAAR